MHNLTLQIDNWIDKETINYLLNLKGIFEVKTDNFNNKISIKYNPDLISINTLKTKILLFLDMMTVPSILFLQTSNK